MKYIIILNYVTSKINRIALTNELQEHIDNKYEGDVSSFLHEHLDNFSNCFYMVSEMDYFSDIVYNEQEDKLENSKFSRKKEYEKIIRGLTDIKSLMFCDVFYYMGDANYDNDDMYESICQATNLIKSLYKQSS